MPGSFFGEPAGGEKGVRDRGRRLRGSWGHGARLADDLKNGFVRKMTSMTDGNQAYSLNTPRVGAFPLACDGPAWA